MDAAEARGDWFSYEKIFGGKAKIDTDIKNEKEGKDINIMRTTRFFYVACTRAQKSLVVIAYTGNIDTVKNIAILDAWFTQNEIILL